MDLLIKYKTEDSNSEETERFIEAFNVGRTFISSHSNLWRPNIDIYSIDDHLYVKADLAGVSTDDVKVSYHNGVLTISGRRTDEEKRKNKRFFQMEIDYGKFVRRIKFPFELDTESAEANYEDGFLIVSFRIITDEERRIKLS